MKNVICNIFIFLVLVASSIVLGVYTLHYLSLPYSSSGYVVNAFISKKCLYGQYKYPIPNDECPTIGPTTDIFLITCNVLSPFPNGTFQVYLDTFYCVTINEIPWFFSNPISPIFIIVCGLFSIVFLMNSLSLLKNERINRRLISPDEESSNLPPPYASLESHSHPPNDDIPPIIQ